MTTYRYYSFHGDCELREYDYAAFDRKLGTFRFDSEPVKIIEEGSFTSVAEGYIYTADLEDRFKTPRIFGVLESPLFCFGFSFDGPMAGMTFANLMYGWQPADGRAAFDLLCVEPLSEGGRDKSYVYFGDRPIAEASGLNEEQFEDFYRNHKYEMASVCGDVAATKAIYGVWHTSNIPHVRLPQEERLIPLSPALNLAVSTLRAVGAVPIPTPFDIFKS